MSQRSLPFSFLVLLCLGGAAFGQPLTIGTLAGSTSGGGYVDAVGTTARFSSPCAIDSDAAGNVYVADAGNHVIRKITPAGVVTTLAGAPNQRGSADGTGSAARFDTPRGIAVDRAHGLVYVSDTNNDTIRRITADGTVTTLAGDPQVSGSNNGTGRGAHFSQPWGLVVDREGNVFVADRSNNMIRSITPGGDVTTFAGATPGTLHFPSDITLDTTTSSFYVADSYSYAIRRITFDGNITTLAGGAAVFGLPAAVDVDAAGNLYVADSGNSTIRKVTPAGVVTTVAGAEALLRAPLGLAVASDGSTVLVADTQNHVVRSIGNGAMSTLAGSMAARGQVDAAGSSARFGFVYDIVTDSAGNAYAPEDSGAIRKITPDGMVTTFAGAAGSKGAADGIGSDARFNGPRGIAVDASDNLYVADTANHTIRKITPAGVVTTLAGKAGERGTADGTGADARFDQPWGIVVDSQGNLFVAEWTNGLIRKVTPSGVVTTFAGGNKSGAVNGVGSGASFRNLRGLTIDAAGNLYVAETIGCAIRKITPAAAVTTIAGPASRTCSAPDSPFVSPGDVAAGANGNLFIANSGQHTIQVLTPDGHVSDVAGLTGTQGNVNGTGTAARFDTPIGLSVTPQGRLLIADLGNHAIRVAELNGAPSIEVFDATPSELAAGEEFTLTWTTSNAMSVRINGAPADLSGSMTARVAQTTTYTLEAQGTGGTVSRSVTIVVTGGGRRRAARH